MITLEFLFGMFIGSLVLNGVVMTIQQSSENGVVGGVGSCLGLALAIGLMVLCGFIGTWVL